MSLILVITQEDTRRKAGEAGPCVWRCAFPPTVLHFFPLTRSCLYFSSKILFILQATVFCEALIFPYMDIFPWNYACTNRKYYTAKWWLFLLITWIFLFHLYIVSFVTQSLLYYVNLINDLGWMDKERKGRRNTCKGARGGERKQVGRRSVTRRAWQGREGGADAHTLRFRGTVPGPQLACESDEHILISSRPEERTPSQRCVLLAEQRSSTG